MQASVCQKVLNREQKNVPAAAYVYWTCPPFGLCWHWTENETDKVKTSPLQAMLHTLGSIACEAEMSMGHIS